MPTSDGEKVSSIRHAGQQDVNFTYLGLQDVFWDDTGRWCRGDRMRSLCSGLVWEAGAEGRR